MLRSTIFAIFLCTSLVAATNFKECETGAKPIGLRIKGCDLTPCDVHKGTEAEIEIDFATENDAEQLTASVRATALGVTIPYPLPEKISNVCKNLANDQECPLSAGEDGTYKFMFPVGMYPEISVDVEVTLKDQDKNTVTCFVAGIKVRK